MESEGARNDNCDLSRRTDGTGGRGTDKCRMNAREKIASEAGGGSADKENDSEIQ